MPSHDRRSAGRRRAWGRGPIILKFDSLEKRELLNAGQALPDLVASSFTTSSNADWNTPITANGVVTNQGSAPVTIPFNVGIYASHNIRNGPYSVLLGEVTIPAGLGAGQSAHFSTTVTLPSTPLPGMSPNGVVHINLVVDPEHHVKESNTLNQSQLGPAYDEAAVQITPSQPAHLVNTSIGVTSPTVNWGGSIAINAQVTNEAYGNAPATQEQVVLTPQGVTPGGPSDVTIGTIDVPALAAWSMVNVEQSIPLPLTPPALLSNTQQFTLSLLPDANYVTNSVYPHVAIGGPGIDQAAMTIGVPSGTTPPALGALPDLAAGAVTTSARTLYWSKSFQVQTSVENLGQAAAPEFRVRFLLTGASGDATHALFLGDAMVPGLQPGATMPLTETFTLPLRLPAGLTLDSVGIGRIVVVVDPQNVLNENFKNNNQTVSGPIVLRLLGTNGNSYVPNQPAPAQLVPVVKPFVPTKPRFKPVIVPGPNGTKRLFRRPPPKPNSLIHELTVFPTQVNDLLKKLV
jgi:hypothetical protein